MNHVISLAHGSGGLQSHTLIRELFLEYFGNAALNPLSDGALVKVNSEKIVFTTDSHVIKPLFYPGGDIGKLAVSGTVNDLAVCGAIPRWISCGMIIEEGFPIADLEKIVISMKQTAEYADVQIVTGDTKVVEKGAADGIFINTAGIGDRIEGIELGVQRILPGDIVIINGFIGDHGAAIIKAREEFPVSFQISSDCRPIHKEIIALLSKLDGIRIMRDPTRGGIATTLNEFAGDQPFGILIHEKLLPIRTEVQGLCEPLGFDPLYLANEGKFLLIISSKEADNALEILKSLPGNQNAATIGEVVPEPPGKVILKTHIGSSRIIDMLSGEMLPRIC
ncbi:MAG TPA: hydrogenase expression/formation protein HypE [Candidatus Marinimicrobia bacterium]|nr:hydrogenase expression/formation protein HypE [Candidatus Neomarinimicrobiota bacterium]